MEVPYLSILFKNGLLNDEVPLLRGAVIAAVGREHLLFHNHLGDKEYRYGYPLIQYKRLYGQAAIVCLKEGVDAIGNFFANYQNEMRLGNKTEQMELEMVRPMTVNIQLWQTPLHYRLTRWLPLNADNYKLYRSTESMTDRIALLERILTGNILSICKGLDIHLDDPLSVKILDIAKTYSIWHKGVKVMAFDLTFSSNISLPDYIGIGKNASLGCGTVSRIRKRAEKET